ncbi:unnamed protein product [Paramecium primaurelia]|uniref:Uncharacterized protein n=1 Tax=Paramecium primaurelia TaxID=5886 RepID=A0A8S1MYC6_PARPR|nr:unnamed protein product [Paramecium primaurelia]
MDHDYFNHIRCPQHNLSINRIIQQKSINTSKRALCYKCPGEGASIFSVYQILDSLSSCLIPIHQQYKNLQDNLSTLKLEITNIINQVYSFIDGAIKKSEFEITRIEKYVYYRKNYKEFNIEDLESISHFIYNDAAQDNPINKSIKLLQEIQQCFKNQLIALFDRIIQLIKGSNQRQNINPILKPPKEPLEQKSTIIKKSNLVFVKKNEYQTSVVTAAIFNKNGDMLFQGQYPFSAYKNLEIKQIDNNFQIKNQSITEESDDNLDVQVTALALNDLTTQLFIGYSNGYITTYQFTGKVWNRKANFKAHTDQVNILIINLSNTELFSTGYDDIIKGYCCSQEIRYSNKEINSIKNICDIQINKESNYLFVIADGKLHILINSQDQFSQFQKISLQNQNVTCITTANNQLYIGSNIGSIYIFEQKNGSQFYEVHNNILIQQSFLQMKYCEEAKLLIVRLDKQVCIYQIGSNNKFDRTQEISGYYSLICIHNNMKFSQIILYCQDNYIASHYIMQKN